MLKHKWYNTRMKAFFVRILVWIKTHKLVAGIGGSVAILLVGGTIGYLVLQNKPGLFRTITQTVTKKLDPPKPATKASPLTGVQVAPELADRPITAVVIENHPDARPQSGLGDAGVVYEALAEGGITRFLAFFLDTKPTTLGPVRSIRTYFVDWALEFNAPVAHVGGNVDALDIINPLGMKDMDEFGWGDYFYRSTDRYAPHNAYTSTDKLDALEKVRGYNKPASFTASPRKTDAPATEAAPAINPTIKINYSYNGYQVEYRYDATTNDYARFLAGVPHIDRNTGKQIHVKNVVVEYMPTSYGSTRIGEQTVIMSTPGSGKSIVFRDGTAVVGTWSKATHTTRTKLLDAAGTDIPLDAGNTWYSIVPVGQTVTY